MLTSAINESNNAFTLPTEQTVDEVTSFSDQQGAVSDSSTRVSERMYMNAFESISLHDFLQRPFVIEQFVWANTDAQFSLLKTWNFPYALFSRPAIARKLANFQYFRGNIKITLKINATRFHYGKLLLSFSPNLSNTTVAATPGVSFVHACSLPNVQVNATDGESLELLVPFSLPFEWINMSEMNTPRGAAIFDMGAVMLFVQNELASGSTSPVNCTLFASFDDIQLAGPTSSEPITFIPPITLQPASPVYTSSFAQIIMNQPQPLRFQSGDSEQKEKSSQGLVSGIAERVASFAAPFSMIPGIGEFAAAISTGASAVGGIAKSFGFSKPLDQSSNTFISARFPVLAQGKGIETAPTLGTFPDNAVSPSHEYIAGQEDDMQLSKIFSTPGFIGSFKILEASTVNSVIYRRFVTPADCLADIEGANALVNFTPLSFAVSAFEYWRGSMRYQFQFVASSFHSVRVRIGWVPPGSTLVADPDDVVNLVNHVLDINTTTEFNVTIPYLNAFPWLTVPMKGTEPGYCTNGEIFVQVVNELTFSETPIPSIDVNVFASAGPDFQVAFPTNYRLFEASVTPPALNGLKFEGGTSLHDIRISEYTPIIESNFFVDNNLCHGEQVTHLKHLLQRSCDTPGIFQSGTYRFNPWTLRNPNVEAGGWSHTFLSWFGFLFRYARGSFGLRALRKSGNGNFLFQNRRISTMIRDRYSIVTAGLGPLGVGSHFVPSFDNFIPEVIVPFYSTQYGVPLDYGNNPYITSVPVLDFSTSNAESTLMEFVGDDFQFGFQLGAPTMRVQIARWLYDNTS